MASNEMSKTPDRRDNKMFFLIEYDREQGRLVTIKTFSDSDRQSAEDARLRLELDLNLKGVNNEIVILDAASEEALRKTHRRYFEDLAQLTAEPPVQTSPTASR